MSALVNDANALVARSDAELAEEAASAVALLALVAGQDVEPAEGSDGTDGRWRIARKVAEDRVISVNDPKARHTRKSPEARRDGYRAHVSAEPATGLITDEQLTRAAGQENSDAAVAAQMLAAREAAPAEVYGDSAYGTGDLRAALSRAGHQRSSSPGRSPAIEGGFTTDDFTVDENAGTVTCPAAVTRPHHRPARGHLRRRLPQLPAARAVHDRQRRPHLSPAPARRAVARRPGATGPPSQPCARTTANTAPTSSASSPRSPAAAGGASSSATGAQPRTTPGSSTGPQPSTCATSSAAAWTPARHMGAGLTASNHQPAGRLRPPHTCQAGLSGKSDHVAGPKGPGLPPHRRPCRRSSRPNRPLFRALLDALEDGGDALAAADAHGDQGVVAAVRCSSYSALTASIVPVAPPPAPPSRPGHRAVPPPGRRRTCRSRSASRTGRIPHAGWCPRLLRSHVHAAVDGPDLPGDVGGLVGRQEADHSGDLLGLPEPSLVDLAADPVHHLVRDGGDHVGGDVAGGDRVDGRARSRHQPGAVPVELEDRLLGQRLGQAEQPGLGGGVVRLAEPVLPSCWGVPPSRAMAAASPRAHGGGTAQEPWAPSDWTLCPGRVAANPPLVPSAGTVVPGPLPWCDR